MAGTIQADFLQPQSGAGLMVLTPSGNTIATINTSGVFSNTGIQMLSNNGSLGNNAILFDANQNVGVGVTPSPWGSGKAIDMTGNTGIWGFTGTYLINTSNIYYDGANWRTKANGTSSFSSTNPTGFNVFAATTASANSVVVPSNILTVGLNTTLVLQGANSTSGVGVAFPPSQISSTDPNTLDDYEEGGWTPTFGGNTTAGTATYSLQSARYTKFGRVVIAHFDVQTTSGLTGAVGVLQVKGLPFPAYNNGAGTLEIGSCSCGYFAGYTGGAYTLSGYIDGGASAINITYGNNGTATAYGDCTKIANGTRIQGTITYITST